VAQDTSIKIMLGVAIMKGKCKFHAYLANTLSPPNQYLPAVIQASPPSIDEVTRFTPAESDSRNPEVFQDDHRIIFVATITGH
jgi:hypothetical protein